MTPEHASRRTQIAKVHVAKKELGLTDGEYRDLLFAVTKKRSAALCSEFELARVIDRMKQAGFKPRPADDPPPGGKAHVAKVKSLWRQLAEIGALTDASDKALRSFVARQTRTDETPEGVAAPEFLNPKQAEKVIEGLKAWLARARKKSRA